MNDQASSITDITFRINEIQSPTRSDLKSIIDRINSSPTAESFWLLSRSIRFAPPAEVKAVIDQIAKLVINNRSNFVGAAFANAHLLRVAHLISYPDGYKWCRNFCFTNNIFWNAQLYNIISLPTYSNILSAQYSFLDSYNIEIQKKGAASIARHSKTPGNLLRRVLATFSSKPASDVEKLQLPDFASPNNDLKCCRLRGFILLASFLTSNPVSLSEYNNSLMPILLRIPETEMEKSLAIEAQNLLSKLMFANPTAFHNINIFDAAIVQMKSNNFTPLFLEAIICSYGIFAFKKFIIPSKAIFIWLDNIQGFGFKFIKVIAPFTKYLDPDLQLQIHETMVNLCDMNRFNVKAFDITAIILMGSTPTISPFMGKFIEIAKHSICARSIMSKLKPILEPKCQPILHPMREKMKVKELEKVDAFAQANPTVKSVLINCDMSREVLFLPKVEIPKKSTPFANFSKPTVKDSKIPVENKNTSKIQELNKHKEEESSDSDIEINLDGPDSDEE